MQEPAHDGGGRLVATVTDPRDNACELLHYRYVPDPPPALSITALLWERGDRFVAHTGFDSCALAAPYRWFRSFPRRIQAWRAGNEMPGCEQMRDGRWLG